MFYETRSEDFFSGTICDHPYPLHVHNVTEIVCLTAGRIDMTIGNKHVELVPGDVAIVFPSIPHSYDLVSPDAQGLTMIFSPNTIPEFSQNFLCMSVADPLLRKEHKPPELDEIILSMQKFSQQQNHTFSQAYLHLFLAYLFSCITLEPMQTQVQSGLSHQALHYISEHFTEPLTLETTADALGISRIHLSHIFSQQLRINFRQYINTLRIDRACYLLRDPAYTISQIAEQCGYNNPRTFHRAFLSQCQIPPKQYRAKFISSEKSDAQPDSLSQ